MKARSLRRWQWIHTWSSLVCTVFLLLICLTGLPLIFGEEIDHLLDPPHYTVLPTGAPRTSLDRLTSQARALFPGQVITSIFMDDDEPQVYVWMAPSFAAVQADPGMMHFIRFDARTGQMLGRPKPAG